MKTYTEAVKFTADSILGNGVNSLKHARWAACLLISEIYSVSLANVYEDVEALIKTAEVAANSLRKQLYRESNEQRRLANEYAKARGE